MKKAICYHLISYFIILFSIWCDKRVNHTSAPTDTNILSFNKNLLIIRKVIYEVAIVIALIVEGNYLIRRSYE
jgi:hypothetical protein